MKFLFTLLSVLAFALTAWSQCPPNDDLLEVSITPDNWPQEISWDVVNSFGQTIAEGDAEGGAVCIPSDDCHVFTIYDSYGDGIFEPGGFVLYLNGDSISGGGTNYDEEFSHYIACPAGALCASAQVITEGTHTANLTNEWYAFTPEVNGLFEINACGSGCNSAIWVYEACVEVDNGSLNALIFNDDGCEGEGSLTLGMFYGMTYYIRVGSPDGSCGSFDWSINQMGLADPCEDDPDLVNVLVHIEPDGWPSEISWTLADDMGNELASGGANGGSICVEAETCIIFNIYDSYGDGIFSPGGYWFYYDNELVGTGNNYGYGTYEEVGCPPGTSCNTPELVGEGQYQTQSDSYWYTFVPETTGSYQITTCGLSDCDTRLQIYDYCDMANFDNTQVGAIYHNDNNDDCGEQADINAMLEAGVTYWIRVSEVEGDCGGNVDWSVNYNGPIEGCTDPTACNFNPLAEIDDGSCIYPGSPDCPNGPDLIINENYLQNTLQVSSITVGEGDCYINEGCLNGYGSRELIRFGTRIENIGNLDFYIGSASTQPQMFSYDNCHNHNHVDGYAEYLLYTLEGTEIPIGFKFGFCVMDLSCDLGGSGQYGCGNMGISAMCADIYSPGLACQWVDVTDVPDGTYTLVVRTNWEGLPDALGNHELDYNNNWGQACISIDRSSGIMEVELVEQCEPMVDCAGEIYGDAQPDCNGDCNGSALRGDLDANAEQDMVDAHLYVDHILGNDITATACTDLNQDEDITVTDAALMALCDIYNVAHEHPDSSGVHTHCDFPTADLTNPFDTVMFNMANLNLTDNYFDIMIRNANCKIVGFELNVSGVDITAVEMLYDEDIYPITPEFLFGGQKLIGLSYQDSTINKNLNFTPLCRVYFTNPGAEICLSEIVDVVNEDYENTLHEIDKACVFLTGVSEFHNPLHATIAPNPMRDQAVLEFANPTNATMELSILDLSGRVVRNNTNVTGNRTVIHRGDLAPGAYLYRLSADSGESIGRFVVQ